MTYHQSIHCDASRGIESILGDVSRMVEGSKVLEYVLACVAGVPKAVESTINF
jgi:hypothetical protein